MALGTRVQANCPACCPWVGTAGGQGPSCRSPYLLSALSLAGPWVSIFSLVAVKWLLLPPGPLLTLQIWGSIQGRGWGADSLFPFLDSFFRWDIIDIKHCIRFEYTTWWFEICVYCGMIATISLQKIPHHTAAHFFPCGESSLRQGQVLLTLVAVLYTTPLGLYFLTGGFVPFWPPSLVHILY